MSKEYKIRDLAKYYVKRYHLEASFKSETDEEVIDGLETYVQELSRLIQGITIDEEPLWDIIKPKKGARKISIADFEKYCFEKWAEYIETHCDGNYNKERLKLDKEYYQDQTESINFVPVTEEDVKKTGYKMMVEALYDIFFEPFDWEQLRHDLEDSTIYDEGYNTAIPIETLKARERLENYHNYIGKRKPTGVTNISKPKKTHQNKTFFLHKK